jgi:hypothetical protein
VGLAAAKIRLQLDHRIAALAADAVHAVAKEFLQTFGDKSASEELRGVLIF